MKDNEKKELAKELAWVVNRAMMRNACFKNVTIQQMKTLENIILEEMPALLDSWDYKHKDIDNILDSI